MISAISGSGGPTTARSRPEPVPGPIRCAAPASVSQRLETVVVRHSCLRGAFAVGLALGCVPVAAQLVVRLTPSTSIVPPEGSLLLNRYTVGSPGFSVDCRTASPGIPDSRHRPFLSPPIPGPLRQRSNRTLTRRSFNRRGLLTLHARSPRLCRKHTMTQRRHEEAPMTPQVNAWTGTGKSQAAHDH